MSVLKRQVNSSSFFIVMTHNSPVNFKLIHFLLPIKGSHQYPKFRDFQVLWWKSVIFVSFSKPQVSFFSNFLSLLSKCNKTLAKKQLSLIQNSYLSLKLTCGFKYDMRNLLNFHPTTKKEQSKVWKSAHGSSKKSENLDFRRFVLSNVYKVSDEKLNRVMSHDTKTLSQSARQSVSQSVSQSVIQSVRKIFFMIAKA